MRFLLFSVLCFLCFHVHADGLRDNIPTEVRPVPPIGIELEEADKTELLAGLAKLNERIGKLKKSSDARVASLIPDVEIFWRAIRDGVGHRELFSKRDVTSAKKILAEGLSRAESLLAGNAPWTEATGLVVRGYRSRIDQTVQPYGLVIPETYSFTDRRKHRLDLWFHGRGERSSETVFINERMTKVGRYAPADTIVLHPYGRYSNAFKFAGEVDVIEALQHARSQYRVDDDRVSVRGFSMGGAGCWQMAVHYPSLFFAANPGAGFSETPEFLESFQQEKLDPTWYERKLWQMYDCPGYVDNLFNLPTIAYSGELDIQKQAADVMEQAFKDAKMDLVHLVGPETKHSIHPDSMELIDQKLEALAVRGRDRTPVTVKLTTYSLKYNKSHWLSITAMKQHWEKASLSARISPGDAPAVRVSAEGVTEFKIRFPTGESPFRPHDRFSVEFVDGDSDHPQRLSIRAGTRSDRSFECTLHLDGEKWRSGPLPPAELRKAHNLQGPIDDAFMDSFIVVKPSVAANHPAVDKWTRSELEHFVREWRRQFRGDAIVKSSDEVTDADVANSNLILFGDTASNSLVAKVIDRLPIKWTKESLMINGKSFDATHHAPAMIYPNPDNPKKYVVLNSGFTYREYAYLNNARQVPKLPDWAIVDLNTPADSLWPGKVVEANFFDESWQVK